MSRGFSRVILIGNLGRDPEMRYSSNGTPITTFPLAVNKRRKEQNGEPVDETSWFRVTLFRQQAENANEWLKKGSKVLVHGEISTRQYTGNDGIERTSVDVTADGFENLTARDGDGAGKREQALAAVAQVQRRDAFDDDLDLDSVPFD